MYGVALRVWIVLFVVLLGFGGCGVVVWSCGVVLWSCCYLVLVVSGVKGALELNGLARLLVSGAGWSMELLVPGVKGSLVLKGLWSCWFLELVS